MTTQNKFCNKSLVFTLTFSFFFIFLISSVSSISWTDQSVIINSFQGNMTNLSELQDVNVPSPSDEDILNYDTSSNNWIASSFTSLNTIWQRIGNTISPKNSGDNLNMSGGNITSIGRAGIGTTNPQQELNVIGDGNFTETMYVGSATIFTDINKDLIFRI